MCRFHLSRHSVVALLGGLAYWITLPPELVPIFLATLVNCHLVELPKESSLITCCACSAAQTQGGRSTIGNTSFGVSFRLRKGYCSLAGPHLELQPIKKVDRCCDSDGERASVGLHERIWVIRRSIHSLSTEGTPKLCIGTPMTYSSACSNSASSESESESNFFCCGVRACSGV